MADEDEEQAAGGLDELLRRGEQVLADARSTIADVDVMANSAVVHLPWLEKKTPADDEPVD